MPKRGVLSLLITGLALVLLLNFKTPSTSTSLIGAGSRAIVSSPPASTGQSTTGGGSTPAGVAAGASASPAPAGTTPGGGSTTGSYKTGTYTGSTVQIPFGPVQVQVTIASGKIANVSILQYPTDRSRSAAIAQYALPQLIQETLQAQSAQVNLVSGATWTSQGYQQSLQSALDQAHA